MCAHCILALCCHKKPNPTAACTTAPVCPFCRSSITQLVVAEIETSNDLELEFSPSNSKPRRSRKSNFSEGSSSFKSLSAMGSFTRLGGISPGKIAAECNVVIDKPWNSNHFKDLVSQSGAVWKSWSCFGTETHMGMGYEYQTPFLIHIYHNILKEYENRAVKGPWVSLGWWIPFYQDELHSSHTIIVRVDVHHEVSIQNLFFLENIVNFLWLLNHLGQFKIDNSREVDLLYILLMETGRERILFNPLRNGV